MGLGGEIMLLDTFELIVGPMAVLVALVWLAGRFNLIYPTGSWARCNSAGRPRDTVTIAC